MSWGLGDIVSGALQIGGAILGHKADKKKAATEEKAAKAEANGQYEAAVAMRDELYAQATDLEATAQRTSAAAALRSFQIERAGRDTAATAIANYAGSGVVVGEGSAAVIPAHIVGRAAEDSYIEIMNSNDQIATIQAQAAANRRQGDVKVKAGLLAKTEGTAAAQAASSAINAANWSNSLLQVGNMADRWLSS